jgi:hypothetical protein
LESTVRSPVSREFRAGFTTDWVEPNVCTDKTMAVSLTQQGCGLGGGASQVGTLARPRKWDEYELIGPSVKSGAADRSTPT